MSFETWNKFVNNLNNCIFNLFNFEIFFSYLNASFQTFIIKSRNTTKRFSPALQHQNNMVAFNSVLKALALIVYIYE